MELDKALTTLAALAMTSRSDVIKLKVKLTDPMSDGDRRAISLLHSVARDRKIDNEISNELVKQIIRYRGIAELLTYALERMFPDLAFLHSSFRRFSNSPPIFASLPGLFELSEVD